jgi:hypothetical protein
MAVPLTGQELQELDRLERWMRDNLELGIAAAGVDAHGNPRQMTTGTLLLTCCFIDSLAAFFSGRNQEFPPRGSQRDDFLRFVRRYMRAFAQAARTPSGRPSMRWLTSERPSAGGRAQRRRADPAAHLYGVFRNGLVHEFLPKGPLQEVRYTRGGGPYLSWNAGGRLVVNVDQLVRDFLTAMTTFCAEVRVGGKIACGRDIQENFRRRLAFVRQA